MVAWFQVARNPRKLVSRRTEPSYWRKPYPSKTRSKSASSCAWREKRSRRNTSQIPVTQSHSICAWMRRFAHKTLRNRGTPRIVGSLTTEEVSRQSLFWERDAKKSSDTERDRVALNLQPNKDCLWECQGRVPLESTQYTCQPQAILVCTLSLRLVEEVHQKTLHGGVGLTMAEVHSRH